MSPSGIVGRRSGCCLSGFVLIRFTVMVLLMLLMMMILNVIFNIAAVAVLGKTIVKTHFVSFALHSVVESLRLSSVDAFHGRLRGLPMAVTTTTSCASIVRGFLLISEQPLPRRVCGENLSSFLLLVLSRRFSSGGGYRRFRRRRRRRAGRRSDANGIMLLKHVSGFFSQIVEEERHETSTYFVVQMV